MPLDNTDDNQEQQIDAPLPSVCALCDEDEPVAWTALGSNCRRVVAVCTGCLRDLSTSESEEDADA